MSSVEFLASVGYLLILIALLVELFELVSGGDSDSWREW